MLNIFSRQQNKKILSVFFFFQRVDLKDALEANSSVSECYSMEKKEVTWVLSDLNSDTVQIADKFRSNINTLGPLANVGWARCGHKFMTQG
uniref:Uncharacterized protein n=1 Tax=Oreochromis aureus TaxID=47969 RepID=A0A668V349_OREAU